MGAVFGRLFGGSSPSGPSSEGSGGAADELGPSPFWVDNRERYLARARSETGFIALGSWALVSSTVILVAIGVSSRARLVGVFGLVPLVLLVHRWFLLSECGFAVVALGAYWEFFLQECVLWALRCVRSRIGWGSAGSRSRASLASVEVSSSGVSRGGCLARLGKGLLKWTLSWLLRFLIFGLAAIGFRLLLLPLLRSLL